MSLNKAFLDYFRCPEPFVDFRLDGPPSNGTAGDHLASGLAYSAAANHRSPQCRSVPLLDRLAQIRVEGSTCCLPFNPTDAADHLRYERYVDRSRGPAWKGAVRKAYYLLRPTLPVPLRRRLQARWLKGWDQRPFPRWPVDCTVDEMFLGVMRSVLDASGEGRIPFIWFWPEGKSSCAIMTHDVETGSGLAFRGKLMDMNDSYGIKSSFQIIPEARYAVTADVLSEIRARGFEVNVHDLHHDGHLYDNYDGFLRAAERINEHALRFGSRGFRSGVLYRNLEWYDAFRFSYDMSVPNVAHLDPQPGGCCTVMPYFIGNILELPVTTTQDYSLFHILKTRSLDLWRDQINRIMQQHGLVSFIVHPDYLDTLPAQNAYTALLRHLSVLRDQASLWTTLPGEVDRWWRQRAQMRLVRRSKGWSIEGPGADRARVAYALLDGGKLTYSVH